MPRQGVGPRVGLPPGYAIQQAHGHDSVIHVWQHTKGKIANKDGPMQVKVFRLCARDTEVVALEFNAVAKCTNVGQWHPR